MKPDVILLPPELLPPGNWKWEFDRNTVAPGAGLSLLSVELGAAEEFRIRAQTSVLLVNLPSKTVTYRKSCSPL